MRDLINDLRHTMPSGTLPYSIFTLLGSAHFFHHPDLSEIISIVVFCSVLWVSVVLEWRREWVATKADRRVRKLIRRARATGRYHVTADWLERLNNTGPRRF